MFDDRTDIDRIWYDLGMAEVSVTTGTLGALVRKGADTDQETKDDAFRLWVELGRSWAATSRHTGIHESTLRNWGNVEGWEQRRADLASSFMPGRKIETAISLRLAAHNAAVRLQQLSYDALENGTKLDHKEVDALTKIVAAGGYSSVGSRDPLGAIDHNPKSTKDRTKFRQLSSDELATKERRVRGDDDSGDA